MPADLRPAIVVPIFFLLPHLEQVHKHTHFTYLLLRHAVQLCMPGGGVRAVIGGGRVEVLQYDWVSLLTQRGQVTDVQLQFVAILIEIQERRENLKEGNDRAQT